MIGIIGKSIRRPIIYFLNHQNIFILKKVMAKTNTTRQASTTFNDVIAATKVNDGCDCLCHNFPRDNDILMIQKSHYLPFYCLSNDIKHEYIAIIDNSVFSKWCFFTPHTHVTPTAWPPRGPVARFSYLHLKTHCAKFETVMQKNNVIFLST